MENLTNWCVYMHENRVNGKKYIGITSQKPTRRWQNGRHYSGNAYFYAAIKKYGWDGFRHEILFTELTQAEAEQMEVELIAKYQTQNPEKGYNMAAGGSANAGWHHTEAAREKIGARTRGSQLSDEHRKRIGDAQRGEKNHAYGKHLSPEHKAKMSAALTGRDVTPAACAAISQAKREANGREVVCIDTGECYGSLAEASNHTGIGRSGINSCCLGKRRTAGGYRWKYAEAVVVDD